MGSENTVNCPFCAERINEMAVVCFHCGRDLQLVRALQLRISDLEARLEAAVAAGPTERAGERPPVKPHLYHEPGRVTQLLVMLLGSSLYPLLVFFWHILPEWLLGPVLASPPMLVGFWLGISIPGVRWRRYLVAGGIMGFAFFVLLVIANFLLDPTTVSWPLVARVRGLPLTLTASMILALSGGLIGNWVQMLRRPGLPDFGRLVAERLSRPDDSAGRAARIETIGKIVNALAPILTFIGTVFAGYLSYLAALAKPAH